MAQGAHICRAQGFAENRVNTSSPGSAAISLRGLGVNSTLVLLNGRRVTLAPFGQGGSAAGLGTEQFVDVNMIPVAAIARIEARFESRAVFDRFDGLTVSSLPGTKDWWWFNVRTSNTEPLLRLSVEASSESTLNAILEEALIVIRS